MDTSVLEDIGLTKNEIKVYLALLELGNSSAGKILEKTALQNSVVHFCINRLIGKGLITYVKKGNVRIYSAAEPDNFLTYLKDKESAIKKILPELKAKQSLVSEKNEAQLFEGMHGIYTAMNTLVEKAKKGDEFVFFSADVPEKNEEIGKFFAKFDLKRHEKGIVTKLISPDKEDHRRIFASRPYVIAKFVPFPVPANTIVVNDYYLAISWGEKPIAVLVKSKQLAKKQKDFFDVMWGLAKK